MKIMSGNTKLILGGIAALLLFGGVMLVGLNSQQNARNGSTATGASSTSSNLNAITEKDVGATITYTGRGFEPNLATVSVNSTIRVRNRSLRVLDFVSGPYNQNSDEPELNIGTLNPDESKTFYVSQIGTWGYYNANGPNETGQIIVR